MAAEPPASVETRAPYGVGQLEVHKESREEKNRENEASRPASQLVKNHSTPSEGN